MTTLTSMREDYFATFVERGSAVYAEENVRAGRWPAEQALALARAETEQLLPQGTATPNHQLLEIQETEGGPTVGFVWFAKMKRGSGFAAFVYQIYVEPQARRKGHARAALAAVERFAQQQGLHAVALHVFAHNGVARAVYEAAGYAPVSLNLSKTVPPAASPAPPDT